MFLETIGMDILGAHSLYIVQTETSRQRSVKINGQSSTYDIGGKKMIKIYDEIVNGKRVIKYKTTDEEIAYINERQDKIE